MKLADRNEIFYAQHATVGHQFSNTVSCCQ